jgi:hypothetical protein
VSARRRARTCALTACRRPRGRGAPPARGRRHSRSAPSAVHDEAPGPHRVPQGGGSVAGTGARLGVQRGLPDGAAHAPRRGRAACATQRISVHLLQARSSEEGGGSGPRAALTPTGAGDPRRRPAVGTAWQEGPRRRGAGPARARGRARLPEVQDRQGMPPCWATPPVCRSHRYVGATGMAEPPVWRSHRYGGATGMAEPPAPVGLRGGPIACEPRRRSLAADGRRP